MNVRLSLVKESPKMISAPRLRISILLLIPIAMLLGPAACNGRASGIISPNSDPSSGSPRIVWTTFIDPFEQAFSVEVPQGWTVRGGLFRMGYSDERPMVDLNSPDGRLNVRLGDLSIPTYTAPNPYHPREGDVYDLGAQAQLIVARYRTGAEFAVLYSHVRFYRDCRDPKGDADSANFTLPDYLPSQGQPARTSTGSIAYRCGSGPAERVAFAYARTTEVNGVWSVPTMGSSFSPPDQLTLARAILQHCASTFRINPQWMQRQQQMDAAALRYQRARQQQRVWELGQQVKQFEAQMQSMRDQVSSFERHQATFQNQVDSFSQALRGVTPTIDPFTGQAREVWIGTKSNYWTNGTSVVNATNGPAGWVQMPPAQP
jgi:hypothetical protein